MEENLSTPPKVDLDSTLEEISKELKPGETLILELESSSPDEVDIIYDTLIMQGYHVWKPKKPGSNQIFVNRRP